MKAPIRTAMTFFRRAKAFIEKNNIGANLPTIKYDPDNPSPEWLEWCEYFELHVGEVPVVMREMMEQVPSWNKEKEMTVPTQFPVLFDSSFRKSKEWKPPARNQVIPRQMREKLEELKARYGPNWGIKDMGPRRKPPTKSWEPPTDDELRARYGKRHDEA